MTPRLIVLVADGAGTLLASAGLPATGGLPHTATLTTVPEGLPVASEVALPGLLGRRLTASPSRGAVEAAAVGAPVGHDEAAWRLDLGDDPAPAPNAVPVLTEVLGARVRHLRRGRFLVVGPRTWLGDRRSERRIQAVEAAIGRRARLWGGGPTPDWPALPWSSVVVAAPSGAAAGISRLLGAELIAPPGATGFPGSDLRAKAAAAVRALDAGRHDLVTVHVGAADEAGHRRDPVLQRRCVEAFDHLLVAAIVRAASVRDIPVLVTADHGTDPRTGRHVAGPVPAFATFPIVASSSWQLVSAAVARDVAA